MYFIGNGIFLLQEMRLMPLSCTKGVQEEVAFPVIELPALLPIEQMIQTGQSHCSVGGVVIQNGVTTNQVISLVKILLHLLLLT